MRPIPLSNLMDTVICQSLMPFEIIIVDGSTNEATEKILSNFSYQNIKYFRVADSDRGLTRQRNFGIKRADKNSEIICFLDDDTLLSKNYFKNLISTYNSHPDALAVGGYITNEIKWSFVGSDYTPLFTEYYYDDWVRKDGSRFVIRKRLGLDTDCKPAYLPEFSHGRSVSFLPPSGRIYQTQQIMGGVSSFRKKVFETLQFSNYFEGYGLYEDADFTLRLSKIGVLYVNTAAQLEHHHAASGRPNQFKYGQMVVRNGWYVWKVKYSNPSIKAIIKWNAITILLILLRFLNTFTQDGFQALTESFGRIYGWITLIFNKPKIQL